MKEPLSQSDCREAVIRKMEAEDISPVVQRNFLYYYDQLLSGETSLISEKEIGAVDPGEILSAGDLDRFAPAGISAAGRCVRIVLNGGLGTTMGLVGPKSSLKVKNGRTFLEVLLSQAEVNRGRLCLMNSFSTHSDTLAELDRIKPLVPPMSFLQHQFPKILRSGFAPAFFPEAPHLEWNPSGHGDIYLSLYTSGFLDQLLTQGVSYALISNSDNLAASLDMGLLGFFAEENIPFMMEVATRLPSDAKGGHLARHVSGRLLLREAAQCPSEERSAFQNTEKYKYFNTNNIWINLIQLKELIQKEGMVRLPMILNPKPLDPRDPKSPPVFQVESAMGAAISLFDRAAAVLVPRSRFFPVKTCNELFLLRSDRFVLGKDGRLSPHPDLKQGVIPIHLDPVWYHRIDDFDARFPHGVPSLLACDGITVMGDVRFGRGVRIVGSVFITNPGPSQALVPDGAVVSGELSFE